MSRPSSTALPTAHVVLRILIVLNWLFGAVVLAILVGLFAAPQWTVAALGIPPAAQSAALIVGMRAIAALGLVGLPLNLSLLRRLVAMVQSVRDGDPFVAVNARHLQVIAWILVAQQVLSILIGIVGEAISTPAHPL